MKDITKITLRIMSMHKLTVVIIENNAALPTLSVKVRKASQRYRRQDSIVLKSMGSRARLGLSTQFLPLAVYLESLDLTSLCLSFLICKMGKYSTNLTGLLRTVHIKHYNCYFTF